MDTQSKEFYDYIVTLVNTGIAILREKPIEFRAGFSYCAGSIINAYREGDLSFDQAVKEIDKLNKKPSKDEQMMISDEALKTTIDVLIDRKIKTELSKRGDGTYCPQCGSYLYHRIYHKGD